MNAQDDLLYAKTLWLRVIRLAFRLLYNELAWTYDLVSSVVSLGQWRQWQLVGLASIRGRAVLEMAHGPGHMLLALTTRRYRAVGLDLSPQMGKMVRRRFQRRELPSIVVRARAQQAPFADESFDSILTTFPAEFIAERGTISELFRLLCPGGRLVVVPEARLTGRSPLARTVEALYRATGQRSGPGANHRPGQVWQQVAARYAEEGFLLHSEVVALPRSTVTVVLADKPERVADDAFEDLPG
jgi:ubiquinone/menaquinone biosynthesis C-methylase UbiE